MKYSYQIYSPSGNDTALVLPLEQDAQKRRLVAGGGGHDVMEILRLGSG